MSGRYLTDLADVVRGAGLVVEEEGGWQTRARSSGGYSSGRPNHVMAHHTASGPSSDGQADVDYMCYGSENRPVANLYLSRSGKVWVMAAGATNTNGTGSDPCRLTADDSMNSSAIGVEAANGGTGEVWPDAQQDAYITLVAALCSHYGIGTGQVHAHFEWAPSRKIDPAGNSRYASGGASWNMTAFRDDVASGGPAPAPPEREDPHMQCLIQQQGDTAVWVSDLVFKRWANNTAEQDDYIRMRLGEVGLDVTTHVIPSEQVPAYGVIAPGSPIPPPPPGYSGRDWLGRPTK